MVLVTFWTGYLGASYVWKGLIPTEDDLNSEEDRIEGDNMKATVTKYQVTTSRDLVLLAGVKEITTTSRKREEKLAIKMVSPAQIENYRGDFRMRFYGVARTICHLFVLRSLQLEMQALIQVKEVRLLWMMQDVTAEIVDQEMKLALIPVGEGRYITAAQRKEATTARDLALLMTRNKATKESTSWKREDLSLGMASPVQIENYHHTFQNRFYATARKVCVPFVLHSSPLEKQGFLELEELRLVWVLEDGMNEIVVRTMKVTTIPFGEESGIDIVEETEVAVENSGIELSETEDEGEESDAEDLGIYFLWERGGSVETEDSDDEVSDTDDEHFYEEEENQDLGIDFLWERGDSAEAGESSDEVSDKDDEDFDEEEDENDLGIYFLLERGESVEVGESSDEVSDRDDEDFYGQEMDEDLGIYFLWERGESVDGEESGVEVSDTDDEAFYEEEEDDDLDIYFLWERGESVEEGESDYEFSDTDDEDFYEEEEDEDLGIDLLWKRGESVDEEESGDEVSDIEEEYLYEEEDENDLGIYYQWERGESVGKHPKFVVETSNEVLVTDTEDSKQQFWEPLDLGIYFQWVGGESVEEEANVVFENCGNEISETEKEESDVEESRTEMEETDEKPESSGEGEENKIEENEWQLNDTTHFVIMLINFLLFMTAAMICVSCFDDEERLYYLLYSVLFFSVPVIICYPEDAFGYQVVVPRYHR